MPTIKQRFAVRVASLTAFWRFEAGLVRGPEPSDGDPAVEGRLRRRVEKLQSALDASNKRQLSKARKQLKVAPPSMPERWYYTLYIVSDKHRFVYLATPKVATTSILTTLMPLFDFGDSEGSVHSSGGIHSSFNHSPHQIDKANFLAGMGSKYHHYFKFTFVRNPWDRLVSCYANKITEGQAETRLKKRKYGDVTLRGDMTFKEFAEAVCRIPDEVSNVHWRSQHITVCDDGLEKNILANFVGRFENLAEDFQFVAKEIGLDRAELMHLAKAKPRKGYPYRDFYDERLARMVGERYREDADLFGYSF